MHESYPFIVITSDGSLQQIEISYGQGIATFPKYICNNMSHLRNNVFCFDHHHELNLFVAIHTKSETLAKQGFDEEISECDTLNEEFFKDKESQKATNTAKLGGGDDLQNGMTVSIVTADGSLKVHLIQSLAVLTVYGGEGFLISGDGNSY
ncbi:MAG2-interacting protein [Trifolium repens]|nr:MAG2-interacting protein [Trifolium repens]